MNQKELQELIEFLIEKDIAEFELERGDVKVRIKRGTLVSVTHPVLQPALHAPATSAVPGALAEPAASGQTAKPAPAAEEGLHIVKSPIVGTFYESPSPGSPPFV